MAPPVDEVEATKRSQPVLASWPATLPCVHNVSTMGGVVWCLTILNQPFLVSTYWTQTSLQCVLSVNFEPNLPCVHIVDSSSFVTKGAKDRFCEQSPETKGDLFTWTAFFWTGRPHFSHLFGSSTYILFSTEQWVMWTKYSGLRLEKESTETIWWRRRQTYETCVSKTFFFFSVCACVVLG